jgi:pectin methylesterase-like acyl-CoA thioesterase
VNKKTFLAAIIISVLFASLVAGLQVDISKANSKTITVPDDYLTIQEAIDHAFVSDTVFVKSGIYLETLTVDKSLSLFPQ